MEQSPLVRWLSHPNFDLYSGITSSHCFLRSVSRTGPNSWAELSQDSSYSTASGCHGDVFHQESEDRILRDVLSRPWSILQYLEYLDSSCLLLLCPRVSNLIILWTISKLSLIQHSSGPSLMLSNPCDKNRIVRKQGHHHELPNISWENDGTSFFLMFLLDVG